MKTPLVVLGLLLATQGLWSAESKITAVTVYGDRAYVTRQMPVELKSGGVTELAFDNLPVGLSEQSLQVTGRGTAKVTILDVSARNQHLVGTPDARIGKLETDIEELGRKTGELGDREEALRKQEEYVLLIRGNSVQAPVQGQAKTGVEEWAKLLAFHQEQLLQISRERRQIGVEREQLNRQVAALRAQLAELRGPGPKAVKQVLVRVEAAGAGELVLSLGYALAGASWSPAYDARLRVESRKLELGYFGQVQNRTGEDWSEVEMVLSTAKPSMGGSAPELTPWYLEEFRPMPMAAMRKEKLDAKAMRDEASWSNFAAEGRVRGLAAPSAAVPVEQEAVAATSTVESGVSSASFRLPVKVSVKADGSSQRFAITKMVLDGKLQYQATPKLREAAFLSAYVSNSSEFPLLAGAMNIFLDESFVSTGRLRNVMPGEGFDLALGLDEGIAVKRRLANRFSETAGLTGKTQRVTYEVVLTVTNNKRTTERIVFSEPIPVSRDERIQVKLLAPAEREVGTKAAPKEATMEEDGRLVFRLDLKPGEKREIPVRIQVEHPLEMRVGGLE